MRLVKLLFPLFLLQSLFAEVVEIKYISELEKYIKDNSVIIFDIDNTVMEPIQEMGNDQWFNHRLSFHKDNGHNEEESLEKALFEWTAVRYLTDMKLVEPHTASLIRDLQNKGKVVFALTTQAPGLALRTIHQLNSLGIHFEKTAPSKDAFTLEKDGTCFYHLGVLFTSGAHKGEIIQKFFEYLKWKPGHVVCINDKASHLKPIDLTCKEIKVPFVGLRYGYLDEKVQSFRKDVADTQFNNLRKLLTDQEAEKMIFSSKKSIVEGS